MEKLLEEILESEKQKKRTLGATHKQKLTNVQIHEKVSDAGYDIGKATINFALARLRKRQKEVYIRQEYEPGQRLEYDFGEVRHDCGEGVKTYHMAVFCAPAANFRWVYLYTNQKKDVFLDSHVRFFEMAGGCWREVVYDNMRNVVKKFIGRGEKELNPELLMLSAYYGFRTNVTNCFKGNEKGSVERSVEVTRNRIFADKHKFASLAAAQEYAESVLMKMNDAEAFDAEKSTLLPYKPPFELGIISENHVNSYSLIVVDSVNYSVPEEFVGKTVTVKKYHDVLRVFCGNQLICAHKRAFGNDKYQIDIYHYLNTFLRKPGALCNSAVLRQTPKLKAIFDAHYSELRQTAQVHRDVYRQQ
jgi:transposase